MMARRNQSEWNILFEAYAQSGLTLSAFAHQHGIAPKYFSLKRQKWLKQQREGNPFIEVSHSPANRSSTEAIRLRGYYGELTLPSHTSPQWLGQLLREMAA